MNTASNYNERLANVFRDAWDMILGLECESVESIDLGFGPMHRISNEEFRTVEWREIGAATRTLI
jgi:hypothetical protein